MTETEILAACSYCHFLYLQYGIILILCNIRSCHGNYSNVSRRQMLALICPQWIRSTLA